MTDFFDQTTHFASKRASGLGATISDAVFDTRLICDRRLAQIYRDEAAQPRQRVLVVGVEVPSRGTALQRIADELACSRHDVSISLVPMQPKGKFENVGDAIANAKHPLETYDWIIITDDDIQLPPNFTDRYLALASLAGLTVSQPAHKFRSHATFQVTRRRFGALVRQAGFVEIGPMTVIRRDGVAALIPFPPSRWAYGIDVLWAQMALDRGWKIGIVDALPIRHLVPVAASYNKHEAIEEGRMLLANAGVTLLRDDIMIDHGELLRG